MTTVQTVFDAAMALMDELSGTGEARTGDTEEYEHRTPAIINMMYSEYNIVMGATKSWLPVEAMDDFLNVSDNYALGVMIYGLAANLLVDENPTAAGFFQQRYEEMRDRYVRNTPGEVSEIENLYGGIEHGQFSRWG